MYLSAPDTVKIELLNFAGSSIDQMDKSIQEVRFESHPEFAQFQKVGAVNWGQLFQLLIQILPLIDAQV